MQYEIISNYRNDDRLRGLFNEISKATFGIDFEGWYKNGFWNEKYIPYSVLMDDRIVSNVSVNIIDCTVGGKKCRYIQLGTIMTDENYRNRGLCSLSQCKEQSFQQKSRNNRYKRPSDVLSYTVHERMCLQNQQP